MTAHDPDQLRDQITALLGPGYPGPGFTSVTVRGRLGFRDWLLEDLLFTNSEGEGIPARFLRPADGHPPVPALIYAHAHGNRYEMGRDELTEGRPALVGPYAPDLQQLGIAALCLEMPCFGARQHPAEGARAKAHFWRGQTLFGQMLAEQRAGVDYLAAHPVIAQDRIGALGFSMGSTLAWWLAALDPRIRAASALCSFADLGTLVDSGAHDGHGIYMNVPGLLSVARSGQIAGLAAPRALQFAVGLQDWSTPPEAFAQARRDVENAFDKLGAPGRLSFHVAQDFGHQETPAMRAAVLDFLRVALRD
ncbi:dienelactone hydrolase family protein [Marinovum sp. 2_MG-2023]|uniref:alpha/beta hydrolase family protein n=1 Tax=unclassified Marinovum TaxID=2647166 RepID=UPI0026E3F766|nr:MULTISPECIES: dienelactone hydrolase family protein [unclassified Marinovum]MDO6728920.1 dienelactone hydrolase family protein [Marinovum sp. 2_MG-2023]MDO6777664.1 dienelactone hydrolase family protein [Marinovum sp. 1_MG-2023]